jgi:hypothetical protein
MYRDGGSTWLISMASTPLPTPDSLFRIPDLSRRAPAEICQVVHPQVCCDLSQALSSGGEESAQQAAALQFL